MAGVAGPKAWSAEADATLMAQRARITLNRKYTPIGRWLSSLSSLNASSLRG
jgi:hypothetical protein